MNTRKQSCAGWAKRIVAVFLMTLTAHAADGIWNGTEDTLWTNSTNWSVSPYPSASQSATFNNAGNGHTEINVAGLSYLSTLVFDSNNAAAYTIGAFGPMAQSLLLERVSTVKIEAGCGSSQVIQAALRLGELSGATTNIFQNDSPTSTLTLAGDITFHTGSTSGQKSVYFSGVGETRLTGNMLKGAHTIVVYADGGSPLSFEGDVHVNALRMQGVEQVVINGSCLLANSVYYPLLVTGNGEITGAGTLTITPVTTDNLAWIYISPNRSLTVSMPIHCAAGINLREGKGTLVLNALNEIAEDIVNNSGGTISAAIIGDRGSSNNNLGQGERVVFNGDGSTLLYTGAGESSDRILEINNNAVLDHSGSGVLAFTSDLVVGGTVKTLTLQGSAGSIGELQGAISAGSATTSLAKNGVGLWKLSGANTCAGTVAVNGGTLVLSGAAGSLAAASAYTLGNGCSLTLENSAAENLTDRLRDAAPITLNGATLNFTHSGGAADFSESAGTLAIVAGKNRVTTSQGVESRSSVLTFNALEHAYGTLDFIGDGIGESDRNRIFITNQPDGLIGVWATVNGSHLAAYSSELGVYAAAEVGFTDIAARGPDSVIPDNSAAVVRINLAGEAGPITLAAGWTNEVTYVLQNTATDAEVALRAGSTNKTLRSEGLGIAPAMAGLKIGEAEGDGFLMGKSAGSDLILANNSSQGELTINAVLADKSAAAALVKSGAGTVTLTAPMLYTGQVRVDDGLLSLGSSALQNFTGAISGAGGLAKTGTGTLRLGGDNSYAGETLISAGNLITDHNNALGQNSAGTVIASGATLDVGGAIAQNTLRIGTEAITVSGSGIDGKGAIVNFSAAEQRYALYDCKVSLAGDTSFGGTQRLGFWPDLVKPCLDLNGYTLTKVGNNVFSLINVDTSPGAGAIDVVNGDFWVVYGARLNGDTANTVTVRDGAKLSLYSLRTPQGWTLALNNRSTFNVIEGILPYNIWEGPVVLSGTAYFGGFDSVGCSMGIKGSISGDGTIVKNNPVTVYLANTNNTYTGETIVSNGVLNVAAIGSLPGHNTPGKIAVASAGTLAVLTGDGEMGWSRAQIDTLRTTAAFAGPGAAIGFDTSLGDWSYNGNIAQAFSLAKFGTNTLTLAGSNAVTGALRVHNGTLNLGQASSSAFASALLTGDASTLSINGALTLTNYGSLTNGAASGDRCVMRVTSDLTIMAAGNSSVSAGKLFIGNGIGTAGAVYQSAGRVSSSSGLLYTDFVAIGTRGGYGYYRMTGGELVSGEIGVTGGGSGNNVGVFDLYQGSIINDGAGFLVGWAEGIGVLNLFNGSLVVTRNKIHITYSKNRNIFGMINLLGPSASVNATGTFPAGQTLDMAFEVGNKASVVNLNNGIFRIVKVFATKTGTPSYFNFNGGTLRPIVESTTFMEGLTAATLYPGGAVIDSAEFNITIAQPLKAPTGYGVTSIPLTSGGTGYIGAPAVQISGGSGSNATAIALVDLEEGSPSCGRVTNIMVTSAGFGYSTSDTLTATLHGGGSLTAAKLGTVLKGVNTGGGLTKLGAGTLTLSGANTYVGNTVISNGTLKLANAKALPPGTAVVLAGGTLDLGGYTVTNTIGGTSGMANNGKIQATFSPAGAGAIGSETFTPGTAMVTGKYLADVTAEGASDLLTIQGSYDLSQFELELVNPALLVKSKRYTIANITGTRTGAFKANSLPDSRWHVVYTSDGTVSLVYTDGMRLIVR